MTTTLRMKPARVMRPLAVFALLAATACSSLLSVQRTPFTVYSPVYTATATAPSGPRVEWQLAIETPSASDTLDTARIAVAPSPGVLEVFPSARWRDPAPAMLRGLIVQAFDSSQRILGVGSAASGLRADYALGLDLRDFQLELQGGSPRAVVRFQARLLDYATSRVLAAQTFSEEAPAAGVDAASAFAAFQTALNAVIPKLVDWTLHEGSAAQRK